MPERLRGLQFRDLQPDAQGIVKFRLSCMFEVV